MLPSSDKHCLVMGDEPNSPDWTDSQSLGGHGDQESWRSDQTNTDPATKQQLRLGLRRLRPERGQSFVALSLPPTFEQAAGRLKVYRSIELAKNSVSKVTVSTLLQRIINLGLNSSGITPITAAVP